MAWSESVDPNYPEIRMETYKSNDPEYKEYNRTHYYDIPTREHLGCIHEDKDDKEKAFQEILNKQKEIAKMNSRFNSFDNVAKMYADIVPLRGARKAEDVRPIWNRRYSWRRVVKINDNKYILHDGDYIVGQRTFEESCDLAPITWERKADGDYITVRNCHAPYYSMSRYAFLSSALPRTMWFKIDNGTHYIVHGGKEHYLAKFKAHYDSNVGKHIVDKDMTITFKAHADGTFERVSELLPMRIRRMNKDLKVKYDPMIKDMWDWACMVLPILGETMHDWNVRSAHAEKVSGGSAWYWDKSTDPKKIREIVEDPEHELRLSLVAIASWTAGAFNEGSKAYTDKTFAPSKDTFREFKKVMRKVIDISAVELR
jgi:hypothetical protein